MSTLGRKIGIGILAIGIVGAAAWWWRRADDVQPTYRTAPIERGALQASVAAGGTVTPVRQVQIGTQVSGQIKEVLVDFNSPVRAGQLLARLDPETFEYRVRQSSADVEAARAQVLTAQANAMAAQAGVSRAQLDLTEARRDLARREELLAREFISAAEVDRVRAVAASAEQTVSSAQAQLRVAEAQVQSAGAVVRQREAQLAQARIDLQRTEIRSPVDGIVIKRSIELGQTVAASLQAPELFIVARNLSDMQVDTSIDEADVSRVKLGQPATFGVDALPGRTFEGTVSQVRKAALNQQNVITYIAVIGFRNPGEALLPGMTANVRIVTDQRDDVLKVPNAALRVRLAGAEVVPQTPFDAKEPPPVTEVGNGAGRPAAPGVAAPRTAAKGRVFVVAEGGAVRGYEVSTGISDGNTTELILPPGSEAAAALREGAAVVVAVPAPAGSRGPNGAGRSPLAAPAQRPPMF
jgi:HlyD family secretion protein